MSQFTPEQLAQIAALLNQGTPDEGTPETETETVGKAESYVSLGFVFRGSGPVPDEGSIVEVPTRSGKTHRIQLGEQVDVSPFITPEEGKWYMTGRKLKRGE